MTADRPIAVLIAALGGEGGGVLTDWLVAAAIAADLPVQSTSIPGVAQRTGATTYYVEIFPRPHAALGGRRPVLGLYPVAGAIDLVVASELLEAGRAMHNGFVSPGRTTLIAAAHRVYATSEKTAMADGRFEAGRILAAAGEIPVRAILFDLAGDAQARTRPLNAVLLGVLADCAQLPIPIANFEAAIRASGIAIESNLAGFALGLAIARGEVALPPQPVSEPAAAPDPAPAAGFPAVAQPLVAAGVARLLDYQDPAYARLYLDRLERLRAAGAPPPVLAEAARWLALWMAFEDIVRVADLKSRPERWRAVRSEVRAGADELVRLVDYLKPGIEEAAALLPPALARRLIAWGARGGRNETWRFGLRLPSTSVLGWLMLRLLARLRPLRRRGWQYAEEQAGIERWLAAVEQAARHDAGFAAEVVQCARLLKGYGETRRRGRINFALLFDRLVEPALAGAGPLETAAAQLAAARQAALADPEGDKLAQMLAGGTGRRAAAE